MRRSEISRGLALPAVAGGAAETVRPVRSQPVAAMGAERLRGLCEIWIVRAEVARHAAVDAVQICYPDLAKAIGPWRDAERVGVLDPLLTMAEFRHSAKYSLKKTQAKIPRNARPRPVNACSIQIGAI